MLVRILMAIALSAIPALGSGQSCAGGSCQPRGLVHVRALPPTPGVPTAGAPQRQVPDPDPPRHDKADRRGRGAAAELAAGFGSGELPPASALIESFPGLRRSESGGMIPPDTQVAAGPQHVFEAVNVEGRILTKSGAVLATFDLRTFYRYPTTTVLVDPRVRFDVLSGRWFVLVAADHGPFGSFELAVSTGPDPTGAFTLYTFSTPGRFPDFPGLGLSDDKVVLTANAYLCTIVCTGSPLGTEFLVLNKAELLAGGPVTMRAFPPDQGLFSIQPAHSLSSTPTLLMAAVAFPTATSIRLWAVTGVPGVGDGVSVSTVDREIAPLVVPPDAVQPGTTAPIDTGDNRLQEAVFRNGVLWVTANAGCVPVGDSILRACLRVIEIDVGRLDVRQDLSFGTAGSDSYYPAIAVDDEDNVVVVFSRSSATEFASVYASVRVAIDPLPLVRAPVLVKAGEAPYDPLLTGYSERRWGDYSGAGLDPSDPSVVWLAGEYARIEGGAEWGTWIARFRVTFLGGVFVAVGKLDRAGLGEIVTGAGAGEPPHVRVFRADGTDFGVSFFAYDPAFTGGVRVAACDVDGDGRAEIITAAGPGGGPHVRVFTVAGTAITELAGFFAYDPEFRGGVWVACGDVDGDGRAEVITGADAGDGPHVRVWRVSPGSVRELFGFFAYDPAFTGGVRVAACDLTGSGRADIVTGAGPGGGPHVRAFHGVTGAELASFFAYHPAFAGGVFVGCGDLTGDGRGEIVTGAGPGGGPHVRVFTGGGTDTGLGFFAYDPAFTGGVRVAVEDLKVSGVGRIVTGAGPGGGPHVREFTAIGTPTAASFLAY